MNWSTKRSFVSRAKKLKFSFENHHPAIDLIDELEYKAERQRSFVSRAKKIKFSFENHHPAIALIIV